MAKNYFKSYIWLLETLQSHGHLTLKELQSLWMRSSVNDEYKELAPRTLSNHIQSIFDVFGIEIECDRSDNTYFIKNEDEIGGGSIRNWMLEALSLNSLLNESAGMKDRIIFEDIPSSQNFLVPIMKAMKEGYKIRVKYKSFRKDEVDERYLNPYCVKSYKQRWYLLASTEENPEPHIYALDRFIEVKQGYQEFHLPEDFNAEEYFAPFCGYPLGSEKYNSPVTVKVKVNSHQRDYFRTLPLHASQEEAEIHDDYSIFTYFVIPNFYLKQELISYMDAVEVLEPEGFRDELKNKFMQIGHIYSK